MGIPHLISTLEPYAEHTVLQDVNVIVDGPALAYHILHVCRVNGVDHPSPRLLGSSVVAWLDKLASQNAVIYGLADGKNRRAAIYFDGYLPTTKRSVRMERAVKSTFKLKTFRANHDRGCPRYMLSEGMAVALIDVFKRGVPERKPLEAPSFLVSSVIQALQRSAAYRNLVHVVPGEADGYCAEAVAASGGVVVTSDSDLLVHNLGGGSVALLRGIHLDDDAAVRASIYHPRQIFHRLGLDSRLDVCRFAYERWRSAHATTPMLLRACTKPVADEVGFREFCLQYQEEERAQIPCLGSGARLSLARLDPRLSEFVLQLPQPPESDASGYVPSLFLPFLIDNPERVTAWENSRHLRQLVYSIACRAFNGHHCTIQEYRRVQSVEQGGRQVGILSPSLADEKVQYIINTFSRLHSVLNGHQMELYWLLAYMILDIQGSVADDRTSLTLDVLQQKQWPSENAEVVPWLFTHFMAQMQAVYYSLRMLRQLIEAIDASDQYANVGSSLRNLPSLTESPDPHTISLLLSQAKCGEIENLLAHFVEIPKPSREDQKLKKRTKKQKGEAKSGKQAKPSKVKNMFELLLSE